MDRLVALSMIFFIYIRLSCCLPLREELTRSQYDDDEDLSPLLQKLMELGYFAEIPPDVDDNRPGTGDADSPTHHSEFQMDSQLTTLVKCLFTKSSNKDCHTYPKFYIKTSRSAPDNFRIFSDVTADDDFDEKRDGMVVMSNGWKRKRRDVDLSPTEIRRIKEIWWKKEHEQQLERAGNDVVQRMKRPESLFSREEKRPEFNPNGW